MNLLLMMRIDQDLPYSDFERNQFTTENISGEPGVMVEYRAKLFYIQGYQLYMVVCFWTL